jgi:hydroxymethylpyrimidine pyrophosphatase-like HAD family hydrolase
MEYYGLSLAEAMAFGDGGNDVPIVRDVGLGVAMENGCDELKAVADYVTLSVDDDGVEKALQHFNLI